MPLIGRDGSGRPGTSAREAARRRPEDERAEALHKLKGLLDSGVLTEEQYEAEKRKILKQG